MQTINVGVDLDGVVTNFTETFMLIANKLFNTPIHVDTERVLKWHFEDWYPITKEQVKEVWKEFETTPRVWETLRPLDVEGMNYMLDTFRWLNHYSKYKIHLFFITHRHQAGLVGIEKQSELWLERHFNMTGIPYRVLQAKNKGEAAKVLQIDFFVDDLPSNCESVHESSLNTIVYIRERAWNRDAWVDSNISLPYVKTLTEFTNLIVEQFHRVVR